MAKAVTIDLLDPLTGHKGPVKTITIREPKGKEFLAFGDPYIVARQPDGTLYPVEDGGAIARYIEACVDLDPLLLDQLGLADAIRVKETVLGFFTDARSIPATPST